MLYWFTMCVVASAAPPPSIDAPPVTGARAPEDFAVVIANQSYTGFSQVPFATRDADAFTAWLTRTRGVPNVNVIRLNDASRKKMEDAVARAVQQAPPGGTLWVYFSGHGLGLRMAQNGESERVLIGINALASSDEIGENVVSLSALERIASTSKANEAVFVLDACFNKDPSGAPLIKGSFAVPVRKLVAGPKVTVWAAAAENETALWYEPAQHGAFTYFAVGALSGWADGVGSEADGVVTLDEAHRWVGRAMSSAGILSQNPELSGRVGLTAVTAKGKLVRDPREVPYATAAATNASTPKALAVQPAAKSDIRGLARGATDIPSLRAAVEGLRALSVATTPVTGTRKEQDAAVTFAQRELLTGLDAVESSISAYLRAHSPTEGAAALVLLADAQQSVTTWYERTPVPTYLSGDQADLYGMVLRDRAEASKATARAVLRSAVELDPNNIEARRTASLLQGPAPAQKGDKITKIAMTDLASRAKTLQARFEACATSLDVERRQRIRMDQYLAFEIIALSDYGAAQVAKARVDDHLQVINRECPPGTPPR